MFMQLLREKKGAALVEYGLLIAGVALISAAAVSTFGHKTNDLVATVAAVLPGAHADDNGAILSGKLIETTIGVAGSAAGTGIAIDSAAILANATDTRLGNNVTGGTGATSTLTDLVTEAN
jgi:Flp pilus assembly pilin Flp